MKKKTLVSHGWGILLASSCHHYYTIFPIWYPTQEWQYWQLQIHINFLKSRLIPPPPCQWAVRTIDTGSHVEATRWARIWQVWLCTAGWTEGASKLGMVQDKPVLYSYVPQRMATPRLSWPWSVEEQTSTIRPRYKTKLSWPDLGDTSCRKRA